MIKTEEINKSFDQKIMIKDKRLLNH